MVNHPEKSLFFLRLPHCLAKIWWRTASEKWGAQQKMKNLIRYHSSRERPSIQDHQMVFFLCFFFETIKWLPYTLGLRFAFLQTCKEKATSPWLQDTSSQINALLGPPAKVRGGFSQLDEVDYKEKSKSSSQPIFRSINILVNDPLKAATLLCHFYLVFTGA